MPSALAARWAQDALPRKNSLMAADAKVVEDAFEGRLSELVASEGAVPVGEQSLPADAGPAVDTPVAQRVVPDGGVAIGTGKGSESNSAPPVDKSVLAIAAPRRYRNREHLRTIFKQPCLVCGRKPSDPHHLRFVQPKALGRKASDEFTVPLCRVHHREVHRAGNERAWWKATGIDPIKVARKLWKETRLDEGRIAPTRSAKRADRIRYRSLTSRAVQRPPRKSTRFYSISDAAEAWMKYVLPAAGGRHESHRSKRLWHRRLPEPTYLF
jgi:hypothetical protein